MGKICKILALLLFVLFLISIATFQPFTVKAQTSNKSAPAIEWQYEYGNSTEFGTEYVSNVIQTSDGGYAFMNLGWMHGFTLYSATLYKVDSLGKIQWEKYLDHFIGQSIVQTSDSGYELTGEWSTYGTTYEETPTLLKTDSNGNIQWCENYTSIPDFNVSYSQIQTSYSQIRTSDGGFAYVSGSALIKTDSGNQTQWKKDFTGLRGGFGSKPYGVMLFSLAETSDGAIVVIGVDNPAPTNAILGTIYLAKTEPFLPVPSPSQLTTPAIPILVVAFLAVMIISVLLFRRHRKTSNLNKTTN